MKVLGAILVVTGMAVGAYVGLWIMFIGGIVDLVEYTNLLVDEDSPDTDIVVWGILKIMFSGFVGYLSSAVFLLPGAKMWIKGHYRRL